MTAARTRVRDAQKVIGDPTVHGDDHAAARRDKASAQTDLAVLSLLGFLPDESNDVEYRIDTVDGYTPCVYVFEYAAHDDGECRKNQHTLYMSSKLLFDLRNTYEGKLTRDAVNAAYAEAVQESA
jgi:hypothetical protein